MTCARKTDGVYHLVQARGEKPWIPQEERTTVCGLLLNEVISGDDGYVTFDLFVNPAGRPRCEDCVAHPDFALMTLGYL